MNDFKQILAGYDVIALVANNERIDVEQLATQMPERTLFVFFTGCEKILRRRFERDSALCHRLRNETTFLKGQKYFDMAHSLLPENLKATVGVIAGSGKAVVSEKPRQRQTNLTPFLIDFDYEFPGFYPEDRMPSTGFALAMWLIEHCRDAKIALCGFTGVAGVKYSVYPAHDWTFEQTLLELMNLDGRLFRAEDRHKPGSGGSFARIKARYPQFSDAQIGLVASQVLASRFTGMEWQMAKLWDRNGRWQRLAANGLRRLKRAFSLRLGS
ncbi:hypothetical protein [Rhizobium glycinendophyticum]|uniref:3-deoxy-manno-octulosonate cytidylyltransferase n=1 Tax=Rhizobium glycinendophyticum TaxID=2589807 RepID=A0A504U8E3_9HYPH|nr:hypothetical protein [Rhizobium glycinendophyticum]TPP10789.1 hypothetical protein FJQ55_08100 [Rhizobium glycinendophyticum]